MVAVRVPFGATVLPLYLDRWSILRVCAGIYPWLLSWTDFPCPILWKEASEWSFRTVRTLMTKYQTFHHTAYPSKLPDWHSTAYLSGSCTVPFPIFSKHSYPPTSLYLNHAKRYSPATIPSKITLISLWKIPSWWSCFMPSTTCINNFHIMASSMSWLFFLHSSIL